MYPIMNRLRAMDRMVADSGASTTGLPGVDGIWNVGFTGNPFDISDQELGKG